MTARMLSGIVVVVAVFFTAREKTPSVRASSSRNGMFARAGSPNASLSRGPSMLTRRTRSVVYARAGADAAAQNTAAMAAAAARRPSG